MTHYPRIVAVALLAAAAACGDSTGPRPSGPAKLLFQMAGGTAGGTSTALYVVDLDGTGLRQLTDGAHVDQGGEWSPDGSRIAFTSNRDGQLELYTMWFDGSHQTRLTRTAPSPGGGVARLLMASWSSRDLLAFLLLPPGQTVGDVATMPAAGGAIRLVSNDTGSLAGGSWSPDGSRIAFTRVKPYGSSRVVVANADGSNLTVLAASLTGGQGSPAWSPDGTRIAFVLTAAGPPVSSSIYLVNPDGTGLRRLTAATALDLDPSWSPDGTEIAFVSTRDGPGDIYVADAATGTTVRRVTSGGSGKTRVRWQPR